MIRLHLKVFLLSKDDSTGHSERKKEEKVGRRRGRQKKRWKDNIKEWTRMNFASSTRTAEDRKGIVYPAAKETRNPVTFKLIENKICCIQEIYVTCKTNCITIS